MKTYKKIVLTVFTLITVASCKKDEVEESNENENLLIGTWLLTKEIDSDNITSSSCNTTWAISTKTINSKNDFDCDGTVDKEFNDSYTLNDSEIIMPGSDYEIIITKLTATKLEIKATDSEDPDDIYWYILYFDRQ